MNKSFRDELRKEIVSEHCENDEDREANEIAISLIDLCDKQERELGAIDQKIIEAFALTPHQLVGSPPTAVGNIIMAINKNKAERLLAEIRTRLTAM